jgi:hypothetical protein
LPLPARLVVDAGGVGRSIETETDDTERTHSRATFEVLRSLQ